MLKLEAYKCSGVIMSIPTTVLQLANEAFAEVRDDTGHQLRPFLRRAIYDAFRTSTEASFGEYALKYLEILTVHHVLPPWQEEKLSYPRDDLPRPSQLVKRYEDWVRGLLPFNSYIDPDIEGLAIEMVNLTGEDVHSPHYPIWCVFEAAVGLFFRTALNPDENITDNDLKDNPAGKKDVAHLALIAYAGRLQSQITDPEKLKTIWEHWYYETEQDTALPWTLTLDPQASLEFWEWWLQEALPRAWQLAEYYRSNPPEKSDIVQLENGILFIGDIAEIVDEDDDRIVILYGSTDVHKETLTGEDARRLSAWLDRDYDALLQYLQANGHQVGERKRPRHKRETDTSSTSPLEDNDIPF
jgi:hypothetical protein